MQPWSQADPGSNPSSAPRANSMTPASHCPPGASGRRSPSAGWGCGDGRTPAFTPISTLALCRNRTSAQALGGTPLPSVSLPGCPYTPACPEPCCAHLQGPQFPSLPRGYLSPQTPRSPITHPGEHLRTWALGSEGPEASPYLHFSTSKMPVSRVWGPQCRRGGVRLSPEEPTVTV